MKKILFVLVFTLLISQVVSAATLDFTIGENTVNILDGEMSVCLSEACPFAKDDCVMVPIRIVAETFGATVEWSDSDRTVVVNYGETTVKLTEGSSIAEVDGNVVDIGESVVIKNGRTMVPAEFLCDKLGCYMRKLESVIVLTNDKPVMRVGNEYIYFDEFALMFNADRDKYEGEEELLAKSCISNLYDRCIMYNSGIERGIVLDEDEIGGIIANADGDKSLKSVQTILLAKHLIADKFADLLSAESIPDDEEVYEYFLGNYKDITFDEQTREEIRYALGYEKFVESWNKLYAETDDESFYEIDELLKLVK